MMKNLLSILLITMLFFSALAQTEFVLDASDAIPHEDGYFLGGFDYDLVGNDGSTEHYEGCPEDGDIDWEDYERRYQYEDRCGEIQGPCVFYDLHNETGEQFGFSYKNVMIMPVCEPKYDSTGTIETGYIQLRPLVDTTDTDILYSYIMSPELSNLQSLTIQASPDISIQPDRRFVPYNIEYSTDGGLTFDSTNYVDGIVDNNNGVEHTYTTDDPFFKAIADASKIQNIVLRIMTNFDKSDLGAYKGQYLKIHKLVIQAEEPITDPGNIAVGLKPEVDPISIRNRVVAVQEGEVSVYSISGHFYGKGQSVQLSSGLYVLITDKGFKKKVFIQ